MSAHPLEVTSLVCASLAVLASGYLFTLKLSDFLKVKRERRNGPMLFITRDNIRRQGFTMAVCAGMVALSISGVYSDAVVTSEVRNLLTGMCVFSTLIVAESVFIYRRREKLALLIAIYEAMPEGIPGGRRKSDPPHTGEGYEADA